MNVNSGDLDYRIFNNHNPRTPKARSRDFQFDYSRRCQISSGREQGGPQLCSLHPREALL